MKHKYIALLILVFVFYPAMVILSGTVHVSILLLTTLAVSLVVGMLQILEEDNLTKWLRNSYEEKKAKLK